MKEGLTRSTSDGLASSININLFELNEYPYIKQLPGLLFCINGHDHSFSFDDIFGNGVMYYGVACTSDRQYMIFNINKEGYRYEVIDF